MNAFGRPAHRHGYRMCGLGDGETMRRPPSMTAQSGAAAGTAKASVIELAVLAALCPLAGIGAGLAFESALVGLAVAGIAVAAYAVAIHSGPWAGNLRKESARLSVTDISTRRREASGQAERGGEGEKQAPPEPEDVAVAVKSAAPERVVPFRMPSVRL